MRRRGLGYSRRRGFGYTATDYASLATQFPASSTVGRLLAGCAANPVPNCADAVAGALAEGYTTAADQATYNAAIAAGTTPNAPPVYTGVPPGITLSQPPVITATPKIQPIAGAVSDSGTPAIVSRKSVAQPAGFQQPPGTQTTTPVAQPAGFQQPPGTQAQTTTSDTSGTILGLPIWLVLAGGGIATYLAFSGGGHGR
jgi:hypothetical protein